ncbi:uncharacterized protein LOC113372865 [Ctenocephalides felis]|uniref:uncharacterized protein LOC113372865 n=1 Tax=Ctenocephalides felis TaxID=7515 RepID=UPI000E6E28D9|nr:uncharacterized protein LOC113372865 [Ctenocephalides felis]
MGIPLFIYSTTFVSSKSGAQKILETVETVSSPRVETYIVEDGKRSKVVSTKSGGQTILETVKTASSSPRVETYIVEDGKGSKGAQRVIETVETIGSSPIIETYIIENGKRSKVSTKSGGDKIVETIRSGPIVESYIVQDGSASTESKKSMKQSSNIKETVVSSPTTVIEYYESHDGVSGTSNIKGKYSIKASKAPGSGEVTTYVVQDEFSKQNGKGSKQNGTRRSKKNKQVTPKIR